MANSSNLAFCLEYSNHKTDMIDAFDDYLKNESMVDVMLSCEGNTIKAHKMVLSAGSTYFRNIFSAFKNPFQFPVLIIKDMPFKDLKAIVEFLYRGEVVVPVEQVSSLSKSAQSLFIKGLEKYFNKSAMVNVGNHGSNASTTSNTTPNNNAVNTSQSNNNVINDPKPSISMSLRKKRRPNYRQLSNGDFDSEEDNSESEQQLTQMNSSEVIQIRRGQPTQVTYGRKNPLQLSKPIKSEVLFNDNYINDDAERDGPPLLEMQLSVGSDSYQIPANNENDDNDNDSNNDNNEDIEEDEIDDENNDKESDDAYQNEPDYEPESYSVANYAKEGQPSTSTYTPSSQTLNYSKGSKTNSNNNRQIEPRGVIRNPVRIAPRRVKTPFMGRHPRRRKGVNKRTHSLNSNSTTVSSNLRIGPIKADPDKVEIIHCSMCPRVFSQTSSLNIHMKRIHGDDDKEHICELCGKKYSWRSGLYKHMRTHKSR